MTNRINNFFSKIPGFNEDSLGTRSTVAPEGQSKSGKVAENIATKAHESSQKLHNLVGEKRKSFSNSPLGTFDKNSQEADVIDPHQGDTDPVMRAIAGGAFSGEGIVDAEAAAFSGGANMVTSADLNPEESIDDLGAFQQGEGFFNLMRDIVNHATVAPKKD